MKRQASRGRRIAAGMAMTGLAAALGACGSPRPAAGGPGRDRAAEPITTAPVRVAHTALGAVGYREIGSGQPLLLIMGYAGTMQTWAPQFADALARHNRVIIFDNAGVGDTRALPAPLSIDAMANQTSALIKTLGLGRPNVLGWSMGGMIAQALAVQHPAQVRRLVLCASFPGTGTLIPPQTAIDNLTNGHGGVLFPAGQPMADSAFTGGTAGYPAAAPVPATVISAQGHASLAWFHGEDAAGRATSRITAPTLVADGTDDKLDAVSNSRAIARLIPGAKLLLYPDAGHGFLFQEGARFVLAVDSFLHGAPAPLSTAAIRAEFLRGEARISAAGKTWAAGLKSLGARSQGAMADGALAQVSVPAKPTAAEVSGIDQPMASALTDLDYQLLSAGATGTLGDAITAFATVGEKVASDVLALAGLNQSTAKTWQATITADGKARLRARAALRKALGLAPQPATSPPPASPAA